MKQNNVNLIARKMGVVLCRAGIKMIESAFHFEVVEHSRDSIRSYLNGQLGNIGCSITLSDKKYYTTNWKTFEDIIEVDWTDKKKYLKERYDCDDFSYSFTTRISEIFELNTAGVAHGTIYKNGKKVGGHFWNAILVNGKNGKELYWYEPMSDKWTKDKKGEAIIMGSWEYRVNSLRFF